MKTSREACPRAASRQAAPFHEALRDFRMSSNPPTSHKQSKLYENYGAVTGPTSDVTNTGALSAVNQHRASVTWRPVAVLGRRSVCPELLLLAAPAR